jgi:hypothetical protein
MPVTAQTATTVIGIDIGKNSFHIVGLIRMTHTRHEGHV